MVWNGHFVRSVHQKFYEMLNWLRIILFLIRSQVFSCSVWTAWLSISQWFTCHACSNSNRITWGMFLPERVQFLHTVMVEKTHKIKFNTVHVLSDSPGWSHWSLGCESGACRSVSIPRFSIIRFCNMAFLLRA